MITLNVKLFTYNLKNILIMATLKEDLVMSNREYKNTLIEMLAAKPTLHAKKLLMATEIKGQIEWINDIEPKVKQDGFAWLHGDKYFHFDLARMKRNLETAIKIKEAL